MKAIPFTSQSFAQRSGWNFNSQTVERPGDAGKTVDLASAADGLTHLQINQIIKLDRSSKVAKIEVLSGILWVTDTPSNGDIVLLEGENLPVRGRWPVVLQALTEATIRLCQ